MIIQQGQATTAQSKSTTERSNTGWGTLLDCLQESPQACPTFNDLIMLLLWRWAATLLFQLPSTAATPRIPRESSSPDPARNFYDMHCEALTFQGINHWLLTQEPSTEAGEVWSPKPGWSGWCTATAPDSATFVEWPGDATNEWDDAWSCLSLWPHALLYDLRGATSDVLQLLGEPD